MVAIEHKCNEQGNYVEQGVSDSSPVPLVQPEPYGAHCEGIKDVDASEPRGDMMSKINAFNDQREEERKRMYHAVIRIFVVGCVSGQTAFLLSIVVGWVLGAPFAAKAIGILGALSISAALVILSTCPLDLLSVDELHKKSPWSFVAFSACGSLVPVLRFLYGHYLDVIQILVGMLMVISVFTWRKLPSCWPATTSLFICFILALLLGLGFDYLFLDSDRYKMAHPLAFSYSLGCAYWLCGTFVFVLWQLRLRWASDRKVGRAMAMFEAMYTAVVFEGIGKGAPGVAMLLWQDPVEHHPVDGILAVIRGVCYATPPILLMLIGRTRVFNILGRRFDRDGARLKRDGAFIAELLDNIPVNVGQLYWIHRDAEDERYEPFDPRRKWRQGRVAAVPNEQEILVELLDSSQAPTRRASAASPRTSRHDPSPRTSGIDFPPEAARRNASPRASVKDRLAHMGGAASSLAASVRIPLHSSAGGKRQETLLLQAQENLRCVDFESLTPDLMMRVDSRNNPELQAKWHNLSRPVRPGETIDYFMSNSWYDNPDKKWQKLSEVAENHRKRTGRYPTFWLDKLCIDQTSITDGLKVLPVNVMACKKLLALCGDTYLSRLWCIWELFTLFAFVTEASALDRIDFVFLGDHEEGIQMLKNMKNFHVKDSHCYDPNEEARLRQVIDAVGTSRFNQRISSLAALTCARLEQQQKTPGRSKWTLTKSTSEKSIDQTTVGKASTSEDLPV